MQSSSSFAGVTARREVRERGSRPLSSQGEIDPGEEQGELFPGDAADALAVAHVMGPGARRPQVAGVGPGRPQDACGGTGRRCIRARTTSSWLLLGCYRPLALFATEKPI